jgi:hypothetical protein
MAKTEKVRVYADNEYLELLRSINVIYSKMSDTKLVNHILANEVQRHVDKGSVVISPVIENDECDITDDVD